MRGAIGMNIVGIINEMELNLMQLVKDYEAALFEMEKLDQRKKELDEFIAKTKADKEGLELAIEGLKSTNLFSTTENQFAEEKKDILEKYSLEPEKPVKLTPVEKSSEEKTDRRGGYKKPQAVIMFGPDNNIRTRWSSMNKCAKDMGWTMARVKSQIGMSRETQLRRYGYYLGVM
jgi:hypothetical protein